MNEGTASRPLLQALTGRLAGRMLAALVLALGVGTGIARAEMISSLQPFLPEGTVLDGERLDAAMSPEAEFEEIWSNVTILHDGRQAGLIGALSISFHPAGGHLDGELALLEVQDLRSARHAGIEAVIDKARLEWPEGVSGIRGMPIDVAIEGLSLLAEGRQLLAAETLQANLSSGGEDAFLRALETRNLVALGSGMQFSAGRVRLAGAGISVPGGNLFSLAALPFRASAAREEKDEPGLRSLLLGLSRVLDIEWTDRASLVADIISASRDGQTEITADRTMMLYETGKDGRTEIQYGIAGGQAAVTLLPGAFVQALAAQALERQGKETIPFELHARMEGAGERGRMNLRLQSPGIGILRADASLEAGRPQAPVSIDLEDLGGIELFLGDNERRNNLSRLISAIGARGLPDILGSKETSRALSAMLVPSAEWIRDGGTLAISGLVDRTAVEKAATGAPGKLLSALVGKGSLKASHQPAN